MSLEYWKREKNFRALEKGYVRDPEGFPLMFLLGRVYDEKDELYEAIRNGNTEEIIKECADVSNLIDYIATKVISNVPDKYDPKEFLG